VEVYVLYHYWGTPDTEGNEVLGVYRYKEHAQAEMRSQAAVLKKEFPSDAWEDDYTWEDENEIHLGYESQNAFESATIYCWTIVKMDVQ